MSSIKWSDRSRNLNCVKVVVSLFASFHVKELNREPRQIAMNRRRNNATLQLVALKEADWRGRYAPLSKDLFHLIFNEKPVLNRHGRLFGRSKVLRARFSFLPHSDRANQTQFPFTINQSRCRTIPRSLGLVPFALGINENQNASGSSLRFSLIVAIRVTRSHIFSSDTQYSCVQKGKLKNKITHNCNNRLFCNCKISNDVTYSAWRLLFRLYNRFSH